MKKEKAASFIRKPVKIAPEKTGRLHVQAIPWGFVTVDGVEPHWETPVKDLILKEGKHSIRVVYEPEGKELSSLIELKEDHPIFCLANFKEGFLECR